MLGDSYTVSIVHTHSYTHAYIYTLVFVQIHLCPYAYYFVHPHTRHASAHSSLTLHLCIIQVPKRGKRCPERASRFSEGCPGGLAVRLRASLLWVFLMGGRMHHKQPCQPLGWAGGALG